MTTKISKEFLSGSTNGRPIKIVQTATAGTLIHTAHATAKDELWLYAVSTQGNDVTLTIEFGGVTSPDDLIVVKLKKDVGLILVVPGVSQSNSQVVRAFASAANEVNIVGYVNRIV
jgi:hypothetical protein